MSPSLTVSPYFGPELSSLDASQNLMKDVTVLDHPAIFTQNTDKASQIIRPEFSVVDNPAIADTLSNTERSRRKLVDYTKVRGPELDTSSIGGHCTPLDASLVQLSTNPSILLNSTKGTSRRDNIKKIQVFRSLDEPCTKIHLAAAFTDDEEEEERGALTRSEPSRRRAMMKSLRSSRSLDDSFTTLAIADDDKEAEARVEFQLKIPRDSRTKVSKGGVTALREVFDSPAIRRARSSEDLREILESASMTNQVRPLMREQHRQTETSMRRCSRTGERSRHRTGSSDESAAGEILDGSWKKMCSTGDRPRRRRVSSPTRNPPEPLLISRTSFGRSKSSGDLPF